MVYIYVYIRTAALGPTCRPYPFRLSGHDCAIDLVASPRIYCQTRDNANKLKSEQTQCFSIDYSNDFSCIITVSADYIR